MSKLLFISSRIPYPLVGGDKIRIYNSLKTLSKKFTIELVYIDIQEIPPESKEELSKYCSKITPFTVSKYSFIQNTFKGFLLNNKPLQVNYYFFKKLKKYIDSVIDDFDAVYCNHIRTTEYVLDKSIPKYVDLVDSIAMNYAKAFKKTKGLWKLIYLVEKKRVKTYEEMIVSSFNKSIVISEVDRAFIDPQNTHKIKVIGNFVQELKYDSSIQANKYKICFLGKMNYEPNVNAVIHFCHNIFPKLKEQVNKLEFLIVGAHPTPKIKELEKIEGVKVTGFVGNPYDIIQSCSLFVAPMISGAGIQNKILEAMKMGKCVITTKIGAEGLENLQGDELVICNEDRIYISKVLELLNNSGRINEIEQKAKKYIVNNFSEKKISNQLLSYILS